MTHCFSVVWFIVLGWALLAGPAGAAHPIRVLLHQGTPELKVSSAKPFQLQFPPGYVYGVATTLTISYAQGTMGMMKVNGVRVRVDSLVLKGGDQDLTVQFLERSSGSRSAESSTLPAAIFGNATLAQNKKSSASLSKAPSSNRKPLVEGAFELVGSLAG